MSYLTKIQILNKSNKVKLLRALVAFCSIWGLAAMVSCSQSSHKVISVHRVGDAQQPAIARGGAEATTWSSFLEELDEPGPIHFEKFVAADWSVERSGMINLDHDKARRVDLKDGLEAIQIYFYVLEHPLFGAFMVDSGVAHSLSVDSENIPIRWPLSALVPHERMKVHLDTKSYLDSRGGRLAGVFLTHLHLDHILGLQDVPKDVPLYVGPGEGDDHRFTHLIVRSTTDLNLEGFGPLREWRMTREEKAPFDYVDVFGDGSVMGLHIPGHTQGMMAYVIRSTQGPRLLVGDGSHTRWGWEHDVEPGTFNTDGSEAAVSLAKLRAFSRENPQMEVHLGHQELKSSLDNHSGDSHPSEKLRGIEVSHRAIRSE